MGVIEFITLFLGGLVVGPRVVEIMADDTVAVVEVWRNGELQERLASPPWKLEVDFGAKLAPHVLEAVALGEKGEELGRARQWINLSPRQAESSLVIEGADRGQGAVARMSWETVAEDTTPQSFEVILDGQEVAAADPHSIPLPPFDPQEPHHLRVRLNFSDALFSEAEAVFGGAYGGTVSTEITAVPVRLEAGTKRQAARSMGDWFTVGGVSRNVHAVERGLAEIVVVRDVGTEKILREMAAQAERLAFRVRLEKHHRVQFISPCPQVFHRDGSRHLIFPRSQRFSSDEGTLVRLLAWVVPAECSSQEQKLSDALGVAGLSASQDGWRRVVLLLLTEAPKDKSGFLPAQVVDYLHALRVPLVVWRLAPADQADTPWGPAEDVHKLRRLLRAFRRVEDDLDRQMVVWIEGLHLPRSIALHPQAEGISMVE